MADDIRAQINTVNGQIKSAYDRKRSAAIALCLQYAGLALQAFRQKQASNKFWTNRTKVALDSVFSDAVVTREYVGWFLAHTVEYGVYLELANNRVHAALLPTVMRFYSRFQRDLEALFAA